MSFLHCHSCNFLQDDYWDKNYNPVICFQDDLETLLEKNLDEVVEMDAVWLKENGYDENGVTRRDLVLYHLRQIESRIKRMVYRTPEELKEKNPERRCPKCNKQDLDED